ncbi:MAG: PQQ-binding-like beta-propeller repeat protein [bacterium]
MKKIILISESSLFLVTFNFLLLTCDATEPPPTKPPGYQEDIAWPSLDEVWPMHRGNPQCNGRSKFAGPTNYPIRCWIIEFPTYPDNNQSFLSHVISRDSIIYTISYSDTSGTGSALYAIDFSGNLKWKYPLSHYKNTSPPILNSEGNIYVGEKNGNILCLTNKGEIIWQLKLPTNINNAMNVGLDGTIYCFASDGNLYAVSKNGNIIWTQNLNEGGSRYTTIMLSPDGNSIYIASNTFFALNLTGEIKWQFNKNGATFYITPMIDSQGNIYIYSETSETDYNGIICFYPSGEIKYIYKPNSEIGSDLTIDKDGNIYFGVVDHLISLNYEGKLRWEIGINAYTASLVSDLNGVIYFVSFDKILYAIDSNGFVLWSKTVEGLCPQSPAISKNGHLVIGTVRGVGKYLYCYK